jgi:hypothetical protein
MLKAFARLSIQQNGPQNAAREAAESSSLDNFIGS